MHEVLKDADLFEGFNLDDLAKLSAIARSRILSTGDYLFLLGDNAECLYVVAKGTVELCLPMTLGGIVKDIPVESASAGKALGWSALVKPYRFTLSARASEPAEVIGFQRTALEQLINASPQLGTRF